MNLKAVIPTGGRGTRMRPITFSANKHLIPVGNKPLIFYPLESVVASGIKEIAITYNPGGLDLIKNLLGNGSRWGVKISYILQPEPKGLANVFQVCQKFINQSPFVMHLGDNIFTEGIENLVEYFKKEKPDALVGMVHHRENTRLGVPYFDKKGRLIKYVEKPKNPPHDWAIPGLYFFNHHVFKCFKGKDKIKPSARGELEIDAPFQWLINHGYRVDVQEIKSKWLDPGKIDDWLKANHYLLKLNTKTNLKTKINHQNQISGPVVIGKNCQIKKSVIKGPVNIGNNVIIKNSIIDPFTSIYHHCFISNSHISNSVLMEGVRISSVKKIIDQSLIGPDVEISQSKTAKGKIKTIAGELSKIKI